MVLFGGGWWYARLSREIGLADNTLFLGLVKRNLGSKERCAASWTYFHIWAALEKPEWFYNIT